MSSAYIIANVRVTDPVQYEDDKKFSTLAMQAHGAEMCVRGGAVQVLEGDWQPDRMVVLKFPGPSTTRPNTAVRASHAKAHPSRAWCWSKVSETARRNSNDEI